MNISENTKLNQIFIKRKDTFLVQIRQIRITLNFKFLNPLNLIRIKYLKQ